MNIAYLAPEIPALSATFVYNEMLALEKLAYNIQPISVHRPQHEASDPHLAAIKDKTIHLYSTNVFLVLLSHFVIFFSHPVRYMQALVLLVKDSVELGMLTRSALGLIYRFFYAGYLAHRLKQHEVQHVHVHFAHVPTDIAMYATHMIGITFSVTAHANDIFERGWLLVQKVERSSFFATISEFNKRYLIEQKKVDASKLRVIRCGVDTLQFKTKPVSEITSPVVVGVLGRLVEKKGIDTLIRSMALLVESGVTIQLNIAGSGPLEQTLIDRVQQLGLQQSVHFLGALPHTAVPEFLASLDLFVLPCKQDANGDMDGIPVVLMEAMMLGVPVISTSLSGIPELVIDDVTGLLAQPDNSDELAQKITMLLNDQTLLNRLRSNAIEKVENEFSQHVNARRLDQLFSAGLTE